MLINKLKATYIAFVCSTLGGSLVFLTYNEGNHNQLSLEVILNDNYTFSNNHTKSNYIEEEFKPVSKGKIERLMFQNINNRILLLESFRSIQSRDLYILTQSEDHKQSEISNISCVLCKNEYSFYDDPDECQVLNLKAIHRTRYSSKDDPMLRTATFFYCKIPNQTKNYTMSTLKVGDDYGHLIRLKDIDKNQVEKNNTLITMCAGPQYGKKKKAVNLTEWIEFHHLMGITKFQIYVTDKNSVSPEYHNMLKKYVKKGLVDLLYLEELSKTHYHTQDALLNHCVWTNKANSDLVAFNDIDEFFVPTNNSYGNWNEVFSPYLKNTNNSEIRFRNWFYDASCPDSKEDSDLILSSVFIREKEPLLNNTRTKYILRPERVLLAGIHKTREFMPEHKENNYKVITIPPQEGYMAHFSGKIKTPECDLAKGKNVETNKDLKKYGEIIKKKVNEMRDN